MNNTHRSGSAPNKMDTHTRRALLFSLSSPTNPVPGSVLSHVLKEANRREILQWLERGWIERSDGNYVLTARGSDALRQPQGESPPESYFPAEFRPSKAKR